MKKNDKIAQVPNYAILIEATFLALKELLHNMLNSYDTRTVVFKNK